MDFAKETRPRKLSEVQGHEKTIKAFEKKSVDMDFPSVMIFEGVSGSGKTSCASIIASVINCQNPIKNEEGYFDPCQECASCKSVIQETYTSDILYFNGGDYVNSETQREAIVQLEEYASLSPWHGGKKTIIIIDEFQVLGGKAKSASLQLLEKKRKDTLFILCTMDVNSIDSSILSRGQVYKFKPLTPEEIGKILLKQLKISDPEEKLPFEIDALLLLSRNSQGSGRQALQYLERCIDAELYTVREIENELGFISEVKAYSMLAKLLNRDKSFYDDMGTIKAEDFYSYTWSILSTLQKTILSLDPDDWKYKASMTTLRHPNYRNLIDLFLKINNQNGYYFKMYIFHYYIGEFLSNTPPVLVQEEKKTRQPRM